MCTHTHALIILYFPSGFQDCAGLRNPAPRPRGAGAWRALQTGAPHADGAFHGDSGGFPDFRG